MVDIDCDGHIDADEFILFCNDFGLFDIDEFVFELFETYDLQKKGSLNPREFESAVKYGILQNKRLLKQINPKSLLTKLTKEETHEFTETPRVFCFII